MTKKEVKTKAYNAILKENKDHQSIFEQLSQKNTGLTEEEIADVLTKIPTPQKVSQSKNVRYIFMVIMLFIAILRIFNVIILSRYSEFSWVILFMIVILVLIIPTIGVITVFTHKFQLYRLTGAFLGYSLFKTLTSNVTYDSTTIMSLIPIVGETFLAFYIPYHLKTNYYKIKEEDQNGNLYTKYSFEKKEKKQDSNLLDG